MWPVSSGPQLLVGAGGTTRIWGTLWGLEGSRLPAPTLAPSTRNVSSPVCQLGRIHSTCLPAVLHFQPCICI